MNAAAIGQRLEVSVARVREQIATGGAIHLDDYKAVFGDPMQSVSFFDLHAQLQQAAAEAARFLQARGIRMAMTVSPEHAETACR